MYADTDDVFAKKDISGVIAASDKVVDKKGQLLTWCKRLPRTFSESPISTENILLDTKRSATIYKNVIKENKAHFYLDRRPNCINDFLTDQAQRSDKTAVRLAEYECQGSTTILDCGDYHVVGEFEAKGLKGVVLHRLKKQTPLPVGKHFKHPSEKRADEFLRWCFPQDQFYVDYEPIILNFSDRAVVIDGVSVHCYNIDFRVRKRTSSCNIGVEVKLDESSWNRNEKEGLFKIQMYEEIMGAPCLVLIAKPVWKFYYAGSNGLEELTIDAVMKFVHRVSK